MKPTQKQPGGELEEIVRLRKRLESLRADGAPNVELMKELTGCFTGDEEWAAIFEEIERQRRIPEAGIDAS